MILAPTLTLSAGSGAAIVRPTFSRDFAGEKTLNNGTGPAITFTRASNATFFDANGVLQTASNDAPRFDHDPATGASRGLLIEEARTNSIRNSQGGGTTAGVIGGGGVMPTNWGISANANGITTEILGTGTEDGLSYIDIKLSGTPTATSEAIATFEPATSVVAANAQTWTQSAYFKLSGGTTANAQVYVELRARTTTGSFISGQNLGTEFTPTSASLKSQRRNVTLVTSDATVGRMLPMARVAYTSGNPINITLRIAAPQLELGAFPTSYIPTTNAAATRSADNAVVTPISSFYNQTEGTLFAEGFVPQGLSGFPALGAAFSDGTTGNRIIHYAFTSGLYSGMNTGGPSQVSQSTLVVPTIGAQYKIATAFKTDDVITAVDGTLTAQDTSATLPVVTQMKLLSNGGGGGLANSTIKKIAYWPKRLSNTLLQQLTT